MYLWHQGQATPGDIAASGAISMRLAQMTGWVSMALMGVWGSVGEVEDGMQTLSPPHGLTDAPDALVLGRAAGRIDFDHVDFAYGRDAGGIRDMDLHIAVGKNWASSGHRARASPPWSRCCCDFTMWKTVPSGSMDMTCAR